MPNLVRGATRRRATLIGQACQWLRVLCSQYWNIHCQWLFLAIATTLPMALPAMGRFITTRHLPLHWQWLTATTLLLHVCFFS